MEKSIGVTFYKDRSSTKLVDDVKCYRDPMMDDGRGPHEWSHDGMHVFERHGMASCYK